MQKELYALAKEFEKMKKPAIALIGGVLLLTALFTGCNGSKVTDANHTDKMLTDISEMLTDAFNMTDTTNGIEP